jgi:PEP-CTERM motif-containing protein
MSRWSGIPGAVLAIALCVGAPAQAVVIDFESLRHDNSGISDVGLVYAEDGFTFVGQHTSFMPSFGTFGTQESRFPGSTAMFARVIDMNTHLTHTGGAEFSIASIDLANINYPGMITLEFIGTKSDFTTVSQIVQFDSFGSLTTVMFGSQFTDLISLDWTSGVFQGHQFDNLVLTAEETVTAVPEPGSLLLLGTGMIALGGRARRRMRR